MATQLLLPSGDALMLGPFSGIWRFVLGLSEETLAAVPAICLIIALPIVILTCRRREDIILPSGLLSLKMIIVGTLASTETSTVISWRAFTTNEFGPAVSTAVCFGALSLVAITNYHHRFSLRSTGVLATWYVLSMTCDCLRLWSLYHRPACRDVVVLTMSGLLLKAMLVVLDEIPKSTSIQDEALRARVSPSSTVGFWSRVFLISFNHSMLCDFPAEVDSQHLERLLPEQSAEQLSRNFHKHWSKANKASRHALLKALFRTSLEPTLKLIFPHILKSTFVLVQPVLIHQLLFYMESPISSKQSDFYLIIACVCAYIGLLISKTVCQYLCCSLVTSMRGTLMSAIYIKTFALPYAITQEGITAILINDHVPNIIDTANILTEVFCGLIEITVALFWLAKFANSAILLMFLCMIAYYALAHFAGTGKLSAENALTDAGKNRVQKTTKLLTQIKAIRITGLNDVISSDLNGLLQKEINHYMQFRLWAGLNTSMLTFLNSATWSILLWGAIFVTPSLGILSAAQIFPYIAIATIFTDPYKDLLTMISMSRVAKALQSSRQMQDFLRLLDNDGATRLADEVLSQKASTVTTDATSAIIRSHQKIDIGNNHGATQSNTTNSTGQPATAANTGSSASELPKYVIRLQNASLGIYGKERRILRGITLHIKRHELVMVAGITGSGKSTFLRSLVNDSILTAGSLVQTSGNIGYCDQKLWLRQASVRDNIVGNKLFNEAWYNKVLHACLLEKDLSQLVNGDKTMIGTNGANLSSAQSSRVALARALYLRAPYLVLDNVFAGLDYGTYCEIFMRLFAKDGILKESPATVIMTTHSTTYLDHADRVIFCHSNGTVSMHTDVHSARFRQCWTTLGIIESNTETYKPSMKTKDSADIQSVNTKNEQHCKTGDVGLCKLYIEFMSRNKLLFALCCIALSSFFYHIPEIYLRFLLEYRQEMSTLLLGHLILLVFSVFFSILMPFAWFSLATPAAAIHLHKQLLNAIMTSKMSFLTRLSNSNILLFFSSDLNTVMKTMPIYVLRVAYVFITITMYLFVVATTNQYCLVLIPIVIGCMILARLVYTRTLLQARRIDSEATTQLHDFVEESTAGLRHIRAFGIQQETVQNCLTLLDASQRPYFHILCTERWLSFAADLIIAIIQLAITACALYLKETTSSSAAGASLAVSVSLVYCLGLFVQDIMVLQTCLSAFARLVQFIDTIPKEKAIEAVEQETHAEIPAARGKVVPNQQDQTATSTRREAAVVSEQRAWQAHESKNKPHLSVAKANDEEINTASGEEEEGRPLPVSWPREGCVVFTDVTAKYDSKSTAPPAIQDVSITIPAGKKVGIIGRTGSGKTSLLMTLLNFLEYSGTIAVDGYDISEIPYLILRQRITTISQEIIDLGGTVQYNLCPWTVGVTGTEEGNTILDSLKIVLESLNMWEVIEKGGGVTAIVADLGLSHGQMQLLTIARGMLHNLKTNSNVVIMDELTSHLDPRNEKIVKAALDKAFRDRTVISVVHREGLLKGADIVLRMEDGKIVETKYPTATKAKTTTARSTTQAKASSSRRAEPPRPQVAPGPPRVIAPALQAMMDYMNNPNAPEPLDPNRHAIAELRMNFERRRMGLPPATLPRQADDPSRPFSWSEPSVQPVQPQQAEPSLQDNQASVFGQARRHDGAQRTIESRRPRQTPGNGY